MGSSSQNSGGYVLPEATAPSLVLAHPTEDEKRRTWTLNHKEWGGALKLEDYLVREPYLTTVPLSRDGGMTHWILTDATWTPADKNESRPVLASCETIRKRVLVAAPGETAVRDNGVGHGLGSVFTYPEYRGNRYAGRMLNELGPILRSWQPGDFSPNTVCSALWSDIGKEYYAKKGWEAFPSLHVELPVATSDPATPIASTQGKGEGGAETTPITYDNLEELCQRDEQLLRAQLLRTAQDTGKTSVAFAPDHDTMRWHFFRDDFIASILFKSPSQPPADDTSSTIKGALAGSKEGRRVWALWARNYYGGSGAPPQNVDKNTLYILRLVVEPEAAAGPAGDVDEDLVAAFAAVMQTALRQARRWHLGKIDLWNPSPTAKRLIERSGLDHRWVDRDTDSIPSLMWYGREDVRDVEWVANEKYCWC
ncbi:hypothetical protein F4819DRAFT_338015 [Hypoxylon fuscum]|nr:hypothetical protein F4819DRAFT_338015 [Hypoxylon fuscum]